MLWTPICFILSGPSQTCRSGSRVVQTLCTSVQVMSSMNLEGKGGESEFLLTHTVSHLEICHEGAGQGMGELSGIE